MTTPEQFIEDLLTAGVSLTGLEQAKISRLCASRDRDIIERCAALVDSFYVEWPNSPTIAARVRALSPAGTARDEDCPYCIGKPHKGPCPQQAECRVCYKRFPHPAPGTGGTWTCSDACRGAIASPAGTAVPEVCGRCGLPPYSFNHMTDAATGNVRRCPACSPGGERTNRQSCADCIGTGSKLVGEGMTASFVRCFTCSGTGQSWRP